MSDPTDHTAEPDDVLAELEEVRAQIAGIGHVLPGSVLEVYNRCGNPGCRCRAQPPRRHGPYLQWTRKVKGKTVTRRLTTEQYQRYQPWFDNARRLRELTTRLETLSLHTLAHNENMDIPTP